MTWHLRAELINRIVPIDYMRELKKYSKETRKKYKRKLINYIKKYPYSSSPEIYIKIGVRVHDHIFKMKDLYDEAGIKYIKGSQKRMKKIKEKIINFIRDNQKATQWEINKKCNTHVQESFKGGIREAYQLAKIEYPEERRKVYGAARKKIRKRSQKFENNVLNLINQNYYTIKRYKNKNGIADGIVEIDGSLFIIEVKDYQSKPISLSDIKQLNRYIEATEHCKKGILVTSRKNKKENIYIGSNRIFIRTIKELERILLPLSRDASITR